MQKLQELDILTGEEYCMGDVEGYVKDVDYFFENAEEISKVIKYAQKEFKGLPTTLCTLYGSMNALASRIGRELTLSERRELCTLRMADKDYSPEVGGLTSAGVDTVRRWWNTHNPDNPVVTFAIDVTTELGKKLFAKKFPVVTSVRGNTAYQNDNKDGLLDGTEWGKTTFGHCRMRMGLTFHDNYITGKTWREYSYPSVENYLKAVNNGYERPIIYPFFLEKELSQTGKKLVNAMKAKIWNGERENEPITRWEASRIALRISLGKVEENKIWNGKNGDSLATKYEVTQMMHNANKNVKIYSNPDRNQEMTRKQAILWLP